MIEESVTDLRLERFFLLLELGSGGSGADKCEGVVLCERARLGNGASLDCLGCRRADEAPSPPDNGT